MDASKQSSRKPSLRSSTRKKTTAAGTARAKKSKVTSSAVPDSVNSLPIIPESVVVDANKSVGNIVEPVESESVVPAVVTDSENPSCVADKGVESEPIATIASGSSDGPKESIAVAGKGSEKVVEGKDSVDLPKESRVQKFKRLVLEAKLKKIQSSYRPRKIIQKKPKSRSEPSEEALNSGDNVEVEQKKSEEVIDSSGPISVPFSESCPVGEGVSVEQVIEGVLNDVETIRLENDTAVPLKSSISDSDKKVLEDAVAASDLGLAGYTVAEISQVHMKRKPEIAPSVRRSSRQVHFSDVTMESKGIHLSPKKAKLDHADMRKESVRTSLAEGENSNEGAAPEGILVNGVWFCSEKASDRWSMIQKRSIITERVFLDNKWPVPEVVMKIEEAGLMKAAKIAVPFCERLIREFVANISEEFGDILEDQYGEVSVRGKTVKIDPSTINGFLGIKIAAASSKVDNWHEVARVLTNGKVDKWRGPTLESKYLTTFYSLLQGICIKNWIPVSHRASVSKQVGALIYYIGLGKPINLGEIIFDQIAKQALTKTSVLQIGHPSLIYQMIKQQAPEVINSSENLLSPKPFTVDWKIFTFQHHVDVTIPPSIFKALQRQGKISKCSQETIAKNKILQKSAVDRVKDQLKMLDQARKEMQELLILLENAEGAQKDEQDEEPASDSDGSTDDQV